MCMLSPSSGVDSLPHSDTLVTGKKARERERKWLKMLDNWNEWITKKQPKVNARVAVWVEYLAGCVESIDGASAI